jgi:Flp pilus assembly protein TadB
MAAFQRLLLVGMVGRMNFEPILAAAVAGIFAFAGIVWQSRKTRRINTEEHSDNSLKLDRIEQKVDQTAIRVENVSDRLDDHIVIHNMTSRKSWWRK